MDLFYHNVTGGQDTNLSRNLTEMQSSQGKCGVLFNRAFRTVSEILLIKSNDKVKSLLTKEKVRKVMRSPLRE